MKALLKRLQAVADRRRTDPTFLICYSESPDYGEPLYTPTDAEIEIWQQQNPHGTVIRVVYADTPQKTG